MSSVARPLKLGGVSARSVGPTRRLARLAERWLIPAFTCLALLYLILPILVMIAFSFNDPPGRFNFVWGQFSLAAWGNPFGRPGLEGAITTSLVVAAISTLIATALGTLIAGRAPRRPASTTSGA